MPQTIAEWLETQPQDVKDLIGPQVEALQNTIKATRAERDALKASGSVTETAAKLQAAERKAAFMEAAMGKRVKNARLVYMAAEADGAYTDDGAPDWDKLKRTYPDLFTPSLRTGAGEGTETKPPTNEKRLQDAFRRK